jgi:hypothetical protein
MMVDTETLGTAIGSAELSIGAVIFDRYRLGHLGTEFYCVIDLQSCLDVGLTIDASTFYFWMKQSDEARAAICSDNRIHICEALLHLRQFYDASGADTVWCHGANFDDPMLTTAYKKALLQRTPWHFAKVRDTRTVYDALNAWPDHKDAAGTYHHALDDAKNQALDLQRAFSKINEFNLSSEFD